MPNKFFSCVIVVLFLSLTAAAQWNADPSQNNAICTGDNKSASDVEISKDGNGGYFIVWAQRNSGVYGTDIYAQHIDSNGNKLWLNTGVVICNAANDQSWPQVTTDDAGGAIIVWQDSRLSFSNQEIYAQRIDAKGNILWAENGLRITVSSLADLGPEIIHTEPGTVVIAWWRSASGGLQTDIYANKIDSSGNLLWSADGIVVSNAPNRQDVFKMISDGANGVILAWQDFRNNSTVPDVYAQNIASDGTAKWLSNGVSICTAVNDQVSVQLTNDEDHGAIISWIDLRSGNWDIYAQRIDKNGNTLWRANGIAVSAGLSTELHENLISDGYGGAIIAWYDTRNKSTAIYAQRINASGAFLWNENAVPIYTLKSSWAYPFMVKSGETGAIIMWQDLRTGADYDIYAQQILLDGTISWAQNGVPVSIAAGRQNFTSIDNQKVTGTVTDDGNGGAILAWTDTRNDSLTNNVLDIYASHLFSNGLLPVKLLYFKGWNTAVYNTLGWATSYETNNLGFEIEYSKNNLQFNKAGFVHSKRDSKGASYSFIDSINRDQQNYYRLKIIDRDGAYQYSNIVFLKNNIVTQPFKIYPNPATDKLYIQTAAPAELVQIADVYGNIVRKIYSNTANAVINLGGLQKGTYFCITKEGRSAFIKL